MGLIITYRTRKEGGLNWTFGIFLEDFCNLSNLIYVKLVNIAKCANKGNSNEFRVLGWLRRIGLGIICSKREQEKNKNAVYAKILPETDSCATIN